MSTVVVMTRPYEPSPRPRGAHRPAAPARTPVRLTRRGRLAIASCLVAPVAVVSALVVGTSEAADRMEQPGYTWVTVEPGETLWQLAHDVAPDVDPRTTIARIIDMNGLTGGGVRTGQRIAVPES